MLVFCRRVLGAAPCHRADSSMCHRLLAAASAAVDTIPHSAPLRGLPYARRRQSHGAAQAFCERATRRHLTRVRYADGPEVLQLRPSPGPRRLHDGAVTSSLAFFRALATPGAKSSAGARG